MGRKTRMRPLRQSLDQDWGYFLLMPGMHALIERAKEHEFAHLMRSQSLGMIDLQKRPPAFAGQARTR